MNASPTTVVIDVASCITVSGARWYSDHPLIGFLISFVMGETIDGNTG